LSSDQGPFSDTFSVSSGLKQGCVLVPTFFSITFALLIREAFLNADDAGIYMNYRTDGRVFSLRGLQAKSKVAQILYANYCLLTTVPSWTIQKLMDCFANAVKRFGLTISLKKTEVGLLLQPRSDFTPSNLTYVLMALH